ncbi:hypothetical protein BDN72DRAFT_866609 [Pluteus cervinus]|uniref:Uncharacterized protein n=1 Tax=Pluteus cervinus TaxID=181527 RepID=A0ACD3BFC0_9AGAR|nr:hypothetical protein BDN72DRAFT_866609 [Pluteus cervinus]
MRVLVLGATSAAGPLLLRAGLASIPDCELIIYTRSPGKLAEEFINHSTVHIHEGLLSDIETLEKAMTGCSAVLSLIGPVSPHEPDTPLSKTYEQYVFEVMKKLDIKRIVAVGTLAASDDHDKFAIGQSLLVNVVYWTQTHVYDEEVAIGKLFKEQEDLDWTLVRAPRLTDGEETETVEGYSGDTGYTLNRAALATWMVKELLESKWVKMAPAVANA